MRVMLATIIVFLANQLLADEITLHCYHKPVSSNNDASPLVVEPNKQQIYSAKWPKSNSKIVEWTNDYVVWTSRSEKLWLHALFLFNRNTSRLIIKTIDFNHSVKDPDPYIAPPKGFRYLHCMRSEKAF